MLQRLDHSLESVLERAKPQFFPLLGMEPAETVDRFGEQARLLAGHERLLRGDKPGWWG